MIKRNDLKHRDEGCMILNTMMVAERFENTMMVGEWFVTQWLWVHDLKHRDGGCMIWHTMIMGEWFVTQWLWNMGAWFENTMMLSAWFETQLWWKNDLKHTDDGWMIWHTMMMGEWF